MPNKHKVRIRVNRQGNVKCGNPVIAKRKDVVEWVSQAGPFVLQFLSSPPVGGAKQIRSSVLPATPVSRTIKASADLGRHPYAVAVIKNGLAYIDASCPEIIIEGN